MFVLVFQIQERMCVCVCWGGGGGVVAKVITISYYISKEVSKQVGVLHLVNHCSYTSGQFREGAKEKAFKS